MVVSLSKDERLSVDDSLEESLVRCVTGHIVVSGFIAGSDSSGDNSVDADGLTGYVGVV